MKNSETNDIQSHSRNTVLSAVEILDNKHSEMQEIADKYYVELLQSCFHRNPRKRFDKIISGMGKFIESIFYFERKPLKTHV